MTMTSNTGEEKKVSDDPERDGNEDGQCKPNDKGERLIDIGATTTVNVMQLSFKFKRR